MAHPMKGAADASCAAKKASMGIHGSTIEPGVQSVKMPSIGESGQRHETQRVPTRKEGGRVCMDDEAPSKKRGDRPAFATGGAVKARKGATTVNVIVAPSGAGAPPPDMGPPPMPPMPMGPPPGMMGPPPGGPPMGPPPGMPMRAAGGRVAKKAFGGAQMGINPAPATGGAPASAPTGAIGTGMGAGAPPASGMLGRPTARPRPGVVGGVAPGAGGMVAMRKHGGKVDSDGDKDCSPQGNAGAGSGVGRLNKAKAAKHD